MAGHHSSGAPAGAPLGLPWSDGGREIRDERQLIEVDQPPSPERSSAPDLMTATSADAVGRLERVPLRQVWAHEALDFTRWLQENLDVLNDVTGLALESAEREQAAGAFNVDLVAEDGSERPVIIENQLEQTNHDHLGKLVTYLAAVGAKAAVWIAAQPRPEHVKAIGWLNESAPEDFYLVKLEAVRIGASIPAPLLTLITGPSPESDDAGRTRKDLAQRHSLRHRWWESLLARARGRTRLHASVGPHTHPYLAAGAGRQGISYQYAVRQHDSRVMLWIDRGAGREAETETIFTALERQRTKIEERFGGPLVWDRSENRRAMWISSDSITGGYRDPEEDWPPAQDALIEMMIGLERGFAEPLQQLEIA